MKRIAYITDSLSWVQAQRAKDLQPYLPEHRLVVMTPQDLGGPTGRVGSYYTLSLSGNDYDAVWLASWRILLAHPWLDLWLRPKHTIVSVTSHYNIGGGLNPETCFRKGADPEAEFKRAIETLRWFRVVTCNSKILLARLIPQLPNVILAQNGVDHYRFTPAPRMHFGTGPIALGWNGILKGAKNPAALKAASEALGYPFFRWYFRDVKKGAHNALKTEFMPGWYGLLDFYVNASFHEGTPNGLLEAAACGLPAITTVTGNAPELVTEGETGWFIEPTEESLIACVERLQYLEPWQYRQMSEAIRAEVEAKWTWEKRSVAYRGALEETCSEPERA